MFLFFLNIGRIRCRISRVRRIYSLSRYSRSPFGHCFIEMLMKILCGQSKKNAKLGADIRVNIRKYACKALLDMPGSEYLSIKQQRKFLNCPAISYYVLNPFQNLTNYSLIPVCVYLQLQLEFVHVCLKY